jgi:hypothetical protein
MHPWAEYSGWNPQRSSSIVAARARCAMKRIREIGLLLLVSMMVFGGMESLVWAGAAPAIQIDLRLDKQAYMEGEPVGLEVEVTNADGTVWINEGFSSLVFYYEMRVIDPSGRLVLVKREGEHIESPDAPPLVSVVHPDTHQIVQVAGCEPLEAGWTSGVQRLEDLRMYYDLSLPGYYSVRVQVSAMVFQGETCDVNDYEWKGVLESETKFFYVRGSSTGVQVIPDEWSTKWAVSSKEVKQLQVHIKPEAGETTADYVLEALRLNGVKPFRVEGLKPMIRAYFDAAEVMRTLGQVQVGQWYTVYISGQRTLGTFNKLFSIRAVN